MSVTGEGFLDTENGKVWYKIVGEGGVPLVVVHGGPGYPHDYLESLEDLADERAVIFYDQLGCGNSDRTRDASLWTIDYFVGELKQLIETLQLDEYYLLGQSWGATVIASYALSDPNGLLGLIFANPYLSSPQWEADAERLIKTLSQEEQAILLRADIRDSAFWQATDVYNRKFVYGMDELPDACNRSAQKMNAEMYRYMWGPTEFLITGTLKNFDLSSRLHEINLPALFLCGRLDEATPEACEYFASLMQNARVEVLEKSAHHAQRTERESYMHMIREFVSQK